MYDIVRSSKKLEKRFLFLFSFYRDQRRRFYQRRLNLAITQEISYSGYLLFSYRETVQQMDEKVACWVVL